jgi:hypothetical protein
VEADGGVNERLRPGAGRIEITAQGGNHRDPDHLPRPAPGFPGVCAFDQRMFLESQREVVERDHAVLAADRAWPGQARQIHALGMV